MTRALAAAKVMPKRKRAVLKLTARCDQGAAVRLTGAIKVTPKKNGTSKPKTKTISLSAVRALAKANVPLTLAMKLPKAVLTALARGAHESARFTLTATNANGTGRAIAKIAGLVKK